MAELCGAMSPRSHQYNPLIRRRYYIECPFLDPRDNKVFLDTCKGCYWNNGIITWGIDQIPIQVNCKYMLNNDFPVQVMSEEYDYGE
jgi:hypothetical protein